MNLCGTYCNDSNAAVLAFLQASLNDTSRTSFKLSFPNAEALQKKVFVGYSIGDLKIEKGLVTEAKMIILHYMVDTSLPNGKMLAEDFEIKIRNFFVTISDISHHIKYSVLSRTRELEEQRYQIGVYPERKHFHSEPSQSRLFRFSDSLSWSSLLSCSSLS